MASGFGGRYQGSVVDDADPIGEHRLRVIVPEVWGTEAGAWAAPSLPPGGAATPAVGDLVWVTFEGGDTDYPIWDAGAVVPDVIVRYFSAHDRRATEDALATFTPDARVHDDGHDYVGPSAWGDDRVRAERLSGRRPVTEHRPVLLRRCAQSSVKRRSDRGWSPEARQSTDALDGRGGGL